MSPGRGRFPRIFPIRLSADALLALLLGTGVAAGLWGAIGDGWANFPDHGDVTIPPAVFAAAARAKSLVPPGETLIVAGPDREERWIWAHALFPRPVFVLYPRRPPWDSGLEQTLAAARTRWVLFLTEPPRGFRIVRSWRLWPGTTPGAKVTLAEMAP